MNNRSGGSGLELRRASGVRQPTADSGDCMHRRTLVAITAITAIAVAFPMTLVSQSPADHKSPDGVMFEFARFADIFGSRLVAAFDSIPAARYDYRPTPPQQ